MKLINIITISGIGEGSPTKALMWHGPEFLATHLFDWQSRFCKFLVLKFTIFATILTHYIRSLHVALKNNKLGRNMCTTILWRLFDMYTYLLYFCSLISPILLESRGDKDATHTVPKRERTPYTNFDRLIVVHSHQLSGKGIVSHFGKPCSLSNTNRPDTYINLISI